MLNVRAQAQPANENTVLPEPGATPSVGNPPKVIGWSDNKPTAPEGFEVTVFADNLRVPRWLYELPNGDVLVSEATGDVLLLRDTNGDGKADITSIVCKGLQKPFGLAYRGDNLYIAETNAVRIYPFKIGDKAVEGEGKKIIDLPSLGYNNHWTRNLLFDPSGSKLFITVGSGTNVDEEQSDAKDPRRAAVLQSNLDGSDLRVYASGLRNPVGLAIEPKTKQLFAVVNERDGLGDDLVPDYLTSIKEGAFYGWPYCYFGRHIDPRKKGQREDLVAKAIVPDYILGAHVAALGLCFYSGKSFPENYRGGAFVGEHGSWNRSKRVGYKVAFVKFEKGKPVGPPIDFLTGFSMGDSVKTVHGRPVGVTVIKDGSLLVVDDGAGIIWRVSYKKP